MTSLPLFPLSSIVMPGGLLPLRLFERRYLDMVTECFREGTGFGVCLLKSGDETSGLSEPYERGTTVSIIDFDQGSDGLLHITGKGEVEFRLNQYHQLDDGLFVGDVVYLEPEPATAMTPEFEALAKKLEVILSYVEPGIQYPEQHLDDADWVCHRLLELLPLTPPNKMELLELDSNTKRLQAFASMRIEISE